jgi:hypothetical protein
MGQCRIIKGRRVCGRRKNNNPFKMWGSYVGTVAGIAYGYLMQPKCTGGAICGYSPLAFLVPYLIGIVVGFLLGWGIQVLWRNFK